MITMYFDLETTGLDASRHGIVQLAAIFEVDGVFDGRMDMLINPSNYAIDEVALKINGRKEEDFENYLSPKIALKELTTVLDAYINKYDGKIKLIGYNSSTFDIPFLKVWFRDASLENFSKYFDHKDIDVFQFVKVLKYFKSFETKNDKLATICEHFGIEINPHEAMSDIEATRELFKVLEKKYLVDIKG